MNNLARRTQWLEEKLGVKPRPREIILTNVDFSDGTEDPIFPGVWAHVYGGGPLTTEDIDRLRVEYAEERENPWR